MKKFVFGLILAVGLLLGFQAEAHTLADHVKVEIVKPPTPDIVFVVDVIVIVPQVHSVNSHFCKDVELRNFYSENMTMLFSSKIQSNYNPSVKRILHIDPCI